MTSQQYQMSLFEESDVWTLSVEDFRARLSALRDTDEVLKIHEELCSLKSVGSHLFSDLNIYSLKTSEECSTMTEGLHLKPSSEPWTDWGMMWSGKYLTARISESLKTGSVVYDSNGLIGTLCARDYKESKQVAIPVLTPDQAEKRQNGRRFKTDGEPMFTLTAQDRHGVVVGNEIKKFGTIEPNFNQSGVVYETDGIAPTIRAYQGGGLEPKIIQRAHGYNQGGEHDIAPTLTSNSYHENNVLKITEATSQGYAEAEIGDSVNLSHPNSKTRRGRVGKQIANTLLTGESQGVVEPDFRIRKLTPRECWRLQGFPDWAFDKAQEVNSNSQLYKQAGNSVTVNVISAIAKELEWKN